MAFAMRRHLLVLLIVLPILAHLSQANVVTAQDAGLPGVRGRLYESPSYGWTLVFDPGLWRVDASSQSGHDSLLLTSIDREIPSAWISFQTWPGSPEDVPACVEQTIAEIGENFPTATFALADVEGDESIYGELTPDHWVASLRASGVLGYSEDVIIDIDCRLVHGMDAVLSITALSTASEHYIAFDKAEVVRSSYSDPGGFRTGAPRARAGDVPTEHTAVLEFGRYDRFTEYLPYQRDWYSMVGGYTPPSRPLIPGESYVLFVGWATNVDVVPALLDLNNLVARVPAAPGVAGDHEYVPAYYGWITGALGEPDGKVVLQPGDLVSFQLWYVVDVPADSGVHSLTVAYEPAGHGTAILGDTNAIGDFEVFPTGQIGGGRPRVSMAE